MKEKLKPIEFYEITKTTLEELAKERGIDDLSRYYKLTDYLKGMPISDYSGLSQIFAQMAFHAQNATMISNIVNFEKNKDFLNSALCHFDPKAFIKKYNNSKRDNAVLNIVEDLRFKNNRGLKWDSSKSKPENKDCIVKRFANTLLDCAECISKFKNRDEFLKDLLKNYGKEKDFRRLIRYFKSKIQHGFSIALTCDFLKEFDEAFSNLPKPDVHIKDTLCAYYGYKDEYFSGDTKEFECIEKMQSLTCEINKNLKPKKEITVYQLDRMIWLICSGNFFLDGTNDPKTLYLDKIKKK